MADQLVKRVWVDSGARRTNGISLPNLLVALGRCMLHRALYQLGR